MKIQSQLFQILFFKSSYHFPCFIPAEIVTTKEQAQ